MIEQYCAMIWKYQSLSSDVGRSEIPDPLDFLDRSSEIALVKQANPPARLTFQSVQAILKINSRFLASMSRLMNKADFMK